eukprot:s3090_g3.t1
MIDSAYSIDRCLTLSHFAVHDLSLRHATDWHRPFDHRSVLWLGAGNKASTQSDETVQSKQILHLTCQSADPADRQMGKAADPVWVRLTSCGSHVAARHAM